jgi:hypothetical protein
MLLLPPFFKDMKGAAGRHKFLKTEDDLLRSLVERYGETNWNLISSFMNRRNARQCRERYKNYLSPIFRNTPWTGAEDQLLVQKVQEIGQRWSVIAKLFEGRSDVNVKNRWAAIQTRNERIERYTQMKPQKGELDVFLVEPSADEEREWRRGLDDADEFRFFM